jgi:hypothetical protein
MKKDGGKNERIDEVEGEVLYCLRSFLSLLILLSFPFSQLSFSLLTLLVPVYVCFSFQREFLPQPFLTSPMPLVCFVV